METPKNHIELEVFSEKVVNGQHEKLCLIEITLSSGINHITPDLLFQAGKGKIKKESIYGFNANIYCNERTTLIIADFDYFTLAAYSNADPILGNLKAYNTKNFFRLNNLKIRRLDSENSNSLIANCEIDEVYVGIEAVHQDRLANENLSSLVSSDTDIRNSTISKVKFFTKQNKVNIQNSKIDEVIFNNDIKYFHCWEGALVYRLIIAKFVDKVQFDDSSIDVIQGQKNAKIKEFSANNTTFVNVFELYENNILSQNCKSLELISESYKNARNREKQFEYSYLYQRDITNNITNKKQRIFRKMLEITCGYGYKPERGFYLLLLIWFVFSLTFTLLSFLPGIGLSTGGKEIEGLIGIPYSMYFSVITFTTIGYGDVVPIDWFTMLLAGTEGILGISTMAIIIYALTKHE